MKFEINFPTGYQVKDIYNDNLDINVLLPGGRSFFATLFTLRNIEHLMKKGQTSFEINCFWAPNMIIVNNLSESTIRETISHLLERHNITEIFSPINIKDN
jgi:hypothetical protein